MPKLCQHSRGKSCRGGMVGHYPVQAQCFYTSMSNCIGTVPVYFRPTELYIAAPKYLASRYLIMYMISCTCIPLLNTSPIYTSQVLISSSWQTINNFWYQLTLFNVSLIHHSLNKWPKKFSKHMNNFFTDLSMCTIKLSF